MIKITGEYKSPIYSKFCDQCGKEINPPENDMFSFELSYCTGESYGQDGASGEKYTLHLCKIHAEQFINEITANGWGVVRSEIEL